MKLLLQIFFVLHVTIGVTYAQDGGLDYDFGDNGIVNQQFFNDRPAGSSNVIVQPDAKIISGGYYAGNDFVRHGVLLRHMPDGSPDLQFNGNGQVRIEIENVTNEVKDFILQPDGKIVALLAVEALPLIRSALVRFHTDGKPDLAFGEQGIIYLNLPKNIQGPGALVFQPDGKFLISGKLYNDGDLLRGVFVSRFLADGTLDESFGEDGSEIFHIGDQGMDLNTLFMQSDGRIIGGGYSAFGVKNFFTVFRFTPDGKLDPTFHNDGISIVEFPHQVRGRIYGGMILPDDRIMMCGGVEFEGDEHNFDVGIICLTPDGYPDPAFGNEGLKVIGVTDLSDYGHDMVLQPDGKILIGGFATTSIENGADMLIVRLKPDGDFDPAFSGDGIKLFPAHALYSDEISGIALQHDGKIITAATLRGYETMGIGLVRFHSGLLSATTDEIGLERDIILYPNPMTNQVSVEYETKDAMTVSLQLLDGQGKVIHNLMTDQQRNPGLQTEHFNFNQPLVPGQYYMKISTPLGSNSMQIICVE